MKGIVVNVLCEEPCCGSPPCERELTYKNLFYICIDPACKCSWLIETEGGKTTFTKNEAECKSYKEEFISD